MKRKKWSITNTITDIEKRWGVTICKECPKVCDCQIPFIKKRVTPDSTMAIVNTPIQKIIAL
ncbi:hypothetical protein NitYY0814_C0562 [Nitratiruptor sp. YY08-14]|nr:hypothetical protein NitYY0810_C0562 [Nitratiruptor sp. YY08-10]BCD63729.1 hypothetical protein NitYY0814_C0562 [Nitratiruptor sp. YY08-14]